jgi:hypothetical protein
MFHRCGQGPGYVIEGVNLLHLKWQFPQGSQTIQHALSHETSVAINESNVPEDLRRSSGQHALREERCGRRVAQSPTLRPFQAGKRRIGRCGGESRGVQA